MPKHLEKASSLSIAIFGIEILATLFGIFADLEMIQLLKKMKKGQVLVPILDLALSTTSTTNLNCKHYISINIISILWY